MPALRGAKVFRSGATASKWNFETENVEVRSFLNREGPSLRFRFDLASKGGGITEVSLLLNPSTFDKLLNEMWKVDREKMVKLMVRQMYGHFWD